MKTASNKTPKVKVGLRLNADLWQKTCEHSRKWTLSKNSIVEKGLMEFHECERVGLLKK